MPTIGDAALRYPNPGVKPDVPLYLQQLAQDVARVTDSVATVADLPASGNWHGRTKIVRSTPGAFWQWDSAKWEMFGVARFANPTARSSAIVAPALGMRSYLTSTGTETTYNGSVWKGASTALVPIIPIASGIGVTVGADGVVMAAATREIKMDSAFTAEFDNYQVELSGDVGVLRADILLRKAGVTAVTFYDYLTQYTIAPATSVAVAVASAQASGVMGVGTTCTAMELTAKIRGPKLVRGTMTRTEFSGNGNGTGTGVTVGDGMVWHRTVDSYDGFALQFISDFTGRIRIYGYNNN